MQEKPSRATMETGFDAFSGVIGSAAKSLERLKAKGMADYGLAGTHTLCMRQLYEAEEGLTRTQLAQNLGVDRAQITRIIGELIAGGYVLEQGGGSNYRKKCVLTERGRELTDQINVRVNHAVAFVSGEIPAERLETFYEVLEEICDRLKQVEEIL